MLWNYIEIKKYKSNEKLVNSIEWKSEIIKILWKQIKFKYN